MENSYWKSYWDNVAESVGSDNVHAQVARTRNKQPINEVDFNKMLKNIEDNISIDKEDVVLDLFCGNGLITSYLAKKCKLIVGVDFSEKNINEINKREKTDNIIAITSDVTAVQFKANSFDKIMIYASLQYLSHHQTLNLFEKIYSWLREGGTFFIGDVPDNSKIWKFYNSIEREDYYFNGEKSNSPLIGTWFEKSFLEKLGRYTKFTEYRTFEQPTDFINAHYRFDMLLKK